MKKENKSKPDMPIIEGRWFEETEISYYLENVKCPGCKKSLGLWSLRESSTIYEGDKINKKVTCDYCNTKFKLKVKGV